jgi:hypothetical protein
MNGALLGRECEILYAIEGGRGKQMDVVHGRVRCWMTSEGRQTDIDR